MPWKMTEDGKTFMADDSGNPVWVTDAGEERGVDYAAMSKKLSETTKEAVQRKDKLREMEARYSALAEIEDVPAYLSTAQKAVEMMNAAPDKEKAMEEQVRARVDAATKPISDKLASAIKDGEMLRAQLQKETVGNAFSRSQFVQEKLVSQAMAADLFAGRFGLKDGSLVAYGDDGQPMYGESGLASFDEALARMVEASPYKGHLLKGSTASGTGAAAGANGQRGTPNPWKAETRNATEQMRLFSENPATAKRMMQEAGVTMPVGI